MISDRWSIEIKSSDVSYRNIQNLYIKCFGFCWHFRIQFQSKSQISVKSVLVHPTNKEPINSSKVRVGHPNHNNTIQWPRTSCGTIWLLMLALKIHIIIYFHRPMHNAYAMQSHTTTLRHSSALSYLLRLLISFLGSLRAPTIRASSTTVMG